MVTPNSIGSYAIEKRLGRGSMGEVYQATKFGSDERVAVKILRGDVADEPELLGRFLRERTLLLSLDDPSLVRVHDLVVEGGSAAIVMDLMEGGDLRKYISQNENIDVITATTLMVSIFEALGIVHQAGIIHRDVKPENFLFDDKEQIHLADFGIARFLDRPQYTQTIGIFGTPAYMAPETGLHDRVTTACDIYSAGIVLFEILAGRTPFVANSPLAMMRLHAEEEVVYPRTFPAAMKEFLSGVLAKNPETRPTALEARDELLALLASKRLRTRSRKLPRPTEPVPAKVEVNPDSVVVPVTETIMSRRRSRVTSEKRVVSSNSESNIEVPASSSESGGSRKFGVILADARRRLPLWWLIVPLLIVLVIVISVIATSSSSAKLKPSSPTQLTADILPTKTVLHWGAPLKNGSSVAKYLVSAVEGGRKFREVVAATSSGDYQAAFAPLTPGESYRFRVSAEDSSGTVLSTRGGPFGTYVTKVSSPIVHAVVVGNEIQVSWRVANDNGAKVTRYKLADNHNSTFDFTGSVNKYVLRNPVKGIAYRFQVTATNAAGQSTSSLTPSITVAAKTNPKPAQSTVSTTEPTVVAPVKKLSGTEGPATALSVSSNGQVDGLTFSWVNPDVGSEYIVVQLSASITTSDGTPVLESPYLRPTTSSVEASISTSGLYVFKVAETIRRADTKDERTFVVQTERNVTVSSGNRLLVSP